jgi:3-hydroxymyristoyl/3-hydroxydecanoyl-(acyl carrier protein) dehydratase
VPGERLDLTVSLGQMSARAGKGHGIASVGGAKAAEADFLFVLAPR